VLGENVLRKRVNLSITSEINLNKSLKCTPPYRFVFRAALLLKATSTEVYSFS
jgi:hypothetical protein